jgi:hypothetical protein
MAAKPDFHVNLLDNTAEASPEDMMDSQERDQAKPACRAFAEDRQAISSLQRQHLLLRRPVCRRSPGNIDHTRRGFRDTGTHKCDSRDLEAAPFSGKGPAIDPHRDSHSGH